MAFQLQYANPYDAAPFTAAYARVSGLSLDFGAQTGTVAVTVWSAKAARDAGLAPVGSLTLLVTPSGAGDSLSFASLYDAAVTRASDPPGTPAYDVVRRTLYQALKGRPPFSSAQDA